MPTAIATVTISAKATDFEGPVSKVEFFRGTNATPIATVTGQTNNVFSYNWTGIHAR